MRRSRFTRGTHYRWKKAREKFELSPLRVRVHDFLGRSAGNYLAVGEIYAKLDPPADSAAKQAAVRTALGELCDKKLAEMTVRPAAAAVAARGVVAPGGPPGGWNCEPKKIVDTLASKCLDSLQRQADAKVKANPGTKRSDYWFTRAQIQADVDPQVADPAYAAALNVTLKLRGCVTAKDEAPNEMYQAATA